MKRSGPLKRKTPMKKGDPKKIQQWKDKSRQVPMKQRSKRRAKEERVYSPDAAEFLREHPMCPVSWKPTTDVHHSAKRSGKWLNLKRYWIAVSRGAHNWIENNLAAAEKMGLVVRIRETYEDHVARLKAEGVDLDRPLYYDRISTATQTKPLVDEKEPPQHWDARSALNDPWLNQ